jgi:hypothetical protein
MVSSSLTQIDLLTPTIEAVLLNAISSIFAQTFTAYRSQVKLFSPTLQTDTT